MPRLSHLLLLLTTLITLSVADDWFMPDSNLISDTEFNSKIVEDKLSFKFVKYFTPHCPYCRYLKAVMDQLKHKKQWCFKIYDFNCQWYPQFCMSNVRSGSFPYTAIYDQNGQMIEQIHGFYPEPIISTIFDRIQERCLAARGSLAPNPTQTTIVVQPIASHLEVNKVNNAPQPAAVEPVQYHQQPKVEHKQKPAEQKKTDIKQHSQPSPSVHVEADKENKVKVQQVKVHEQHTTQQNHIQSSQKLIQKAKQAERRTLNEKQAKKGEHTSSESTIPHNYLFYGVCLVCAAYYVYTLHADKPNPEVKQTPNPITPKRSQKQNPTEVKQNQKLQAQPSMQQSELLKNIPDQEL